MSSFHSFSVSSSSMSPLSYILGYGKKIKTTHWGKKSGKPNTHGNNFPFSQQVQRPSLTTIPEMSRINVVVDIQAELRLHFTHCLSFSIQQPIMPQGKRRTPMAIAAGGKLSSIAPPQYVQLFPTRFLYSATCFSLHLWHHPYITSCGSPDFSSSVHSHMATIFIQKRHFPHPLRTHLVGLGGGTGGILAGVWTGSDQAPVTSHQSALST